ncbi:hypothetical protein K3495_g16192 [Podosphaera aphanis]|nr:hypothetical protein K3495_g16192 [Podosphaera aphanis]
MKRGPQVGKKTTLLDETQSGSSAEATSTTDKGKEKTRHLNEINGREGLGPIDYKDMLAQIRVNISILDLMQISPDAAKAFKHYSTRRNKKKGRKASQSNPATVNFLNASNQGAAPRGIQQKDRPFRLLDATIVCPKMKSKLVLDTGVAQADQGSDINLISDLLVDTLNVEKRELPGVRGFMMQTADGNLTTLRTFAVFELGVAGIWRTFNLRASLAILGQGHDQHLRKLYRDWRSSKSPERQPKKDCKMRNVEEQPPPKTHAVTSARGCRGGYETARSRPPYLSRLP